MKVLTKAELQCVCVQPQSDILVASLPHPLLSAKSLTGCNSSFFHLLSGGWGTGRPATVVFASLFPRLADFLSKEGDRTRGVFRSVTSLAVRAEFVLCFADRHSYDRINARVCVSPTLSVMFAENKVAFTSIPAFSLSYTI